MNKTRKVIAFLAVFLMIFGNMSTALAATTNPNNSGSDWSMLSGFGFGGKYVAKLDQSGNINYTVLSSDRFYSKNNATSKTYGGSGSGSLGKPPIEYVIVKSSTNYYVYTAGGAFVEKSGGSSTYTVSVTYNGSGYPTIRVTKASGQDISHVYFVTGYTPKGKLIVDKEVKGSNVSSSDKSFDYTFKVVGPAPATTEWTVTASHNDNGELILPYGSYTISEVNIPDGFSSSLSKTSFTINDDCDELTIKATNTKLPKGKLTVDKEVKGPFVTNADKAFDFTFKIIGPAPATTERTVTASHYDDGELWLPYGTYTISEVNIPNGFSVSLSKTTFTINDDCEDLTIKATNTKLQGTLTVDKVVSGLNVTNADKAFSYSFKVVGPAPATTEWAVSATDGSDGTLNLPYGDYSISETNLPSGFSASLDKTSFTIGASSVNVKVIATNTKLHGTLTVDKVVTGPNVTDADKAINFSFKVVGPSPATTEWTVSASDGSDGTLNLPYGNYTISEVSIPGGFSASLDKSSFAIGPDATSVKVIATNTKLHGTLTVDKVVTGPNVTDADKAFGFSFKVVGPAPATTEWTVSASHNSDGTLDLPYGNYTISEVSIPGGFSASLDKSSFAIGPNATSVKVTATNTKLHGSLIVNKALAGLNLTDADMARSYDFKVVGPAPATTEWSVSATDSTNGLLDNLPYGSYTIEEINIPGGFSAALDKTSFTIGGGDANVITVNATNTKQHGTLTVAKTVAGLNLTDADLARSYQFKVVGPAPALTEWSVSATDAVDGTLNLPYGNYTIEEINIPSGFSALLDKTSFTIGAETANITVTATNTKQHGTLTVAKTVAGLNVTDADLARTYEFKVVGPAPALTEWSVSATDAVDGTLDLPYGSYTIEEINIPSGFDAALDKTSFTIGAETANITVTATNTKLHGTLTVDKVVTGSNVTDADKAFNFSFKVVGPAPATTEWSVSASDGSDGTLNLPYGSYTIEEISIPNGFDAALDKTSFTIGAETTNITVTATNTKLQGKLTVAKTVDGLNLTNDDLARSYNFKVVGPAPALTEWSVPATDAVDGELNLPYGDYTIEEINIPGGFSATLDKTSFTIGAETVNVTVNATNTKLSRRVTIDKVLAGPNLTDGDKALEYEFKIVGPAPATTVWTIKSTDATSGYLDLPFGTYTVEELNVPGDFVSQLSTSEFTINAETEAIAITATNTKQFGSLKLTKAVAGADDNDATEFQFTVTGPNGFSQVVTLINGAAQTLDNLAWGDYQITETNIPVGYQALDGVITVTVGAEVRNVEVTYHNQKQSGIHIVKIDSATKLGVEGVTLEVARVNQETAVARLFASIFGTATQQVVTGPNGTIDVFNLEPGDYKVTELSAPTGYVIDTTPKTVTLEAGEVETVEFANDPQGFLKIIKTNSDTGEALAGAEFALANNADFTDAVTLTTAADGTVTSAALIPGPWFVKETKAPAGYALDETVKPVTVVLGQTIEVPLTNDPQGFVKIIKTDIVSGDELAGAEFALADNEAMTNPTTLTTAADGTVTSGALIPGTWYIQETKAPEGYVLDDTIHTVTVELGETTEVPLTNAMIPGQLRLLKVDPDGNPLAGALFAIFSDEELSAMVASGTTDANGEINVDNLRPGTYWVREVEAPDGYVRLEDAVPADVTAGHLTVLTLPNQKDDTGGFEDEKGQLNLHKVDGYTKKPLANAKFSLYSDEALKTLVGSGTTGADGIIEFKDLEPGIYYLVETAAPKGYKLNSTAISVAVIAGEITNQTVTNELDDTKDYQTGSMDYNILLGGGAALLLGAALVVFTRKRRTAKGTKH